MPWKEMDAMLLRAEFVARGEQEGPSLSPASAKTTRREGKFFLERQRLPRNRCRSNPQEFANRC